MVWTLVRRRNSGAWERLEDLLALAHSSRPEPSVLQNTCAGISQATTRSQNVRIVAVRDPWEGEERVQMVFTDDGSSREDRAGDVEADVTYGKVKQERSRSRSRGSKNRARESRRSAALY